MKPSFWFRLTSSIRWVSGGFFFVVILAVILSLGWFRTPQQLFPVLQKLMQCMIRASGIRIADQGMGNLSSEKRYLYMSNHNSFLDHFLIAARIPGFAVGAEKAENFTIPIYGAFIKWWGQLPVARGDKNRAIQTIKDAQERLSSRTSLVFMPEGTRGEDSTVAPFKKGGFHMAMALGIPIVPLSILGIRKVNPDGKFFLRSGTVKLVFHEPISTSDKSVDELMTQVRNVMLSQGLESSPVAAEAQ